MRTDRPGSGPPLPSASGISFSVVFPLIPDGVSFAWLPALLLPPAAAALRELHAPKVISQETRFGPKPSLHLYRYVLLTNYGYGFASSL